eukprot:364853-Chlamydomonas_euryale.AAC.7
MWEVWKCARGRGYVSSVAPAGMSVGDGEVWEGWYAHKVEDVANSTAPCEAFGSENAKQGLRPNAQSPGPWFRNSNHSEGVHDAR